MVNAVGYLRANANWGVVQVERTEVQQQSAFALFQTVLTGLQEGKPLNCAYGLSAREFVVEVYDNRYLAKLGCFWDLFETIWNIFLRCLTCIGCEETEAGQVATLAGAIRDFPLVAGNYPLSSIRAKMAALANNLFNIPVERRDAIFQSIKQNPQEYPFWGIQAQAAAIGQMSLQQLWAYFDGLQPYLQALHNDRGEGNQTINNARKGGLELSMIRALEEARGGNVAAAVAKIPNPDNYLYLDNDNPGAEAVRALMHLCWWVEGDQWVVDDKSLSSLFGLHCLQRGWMAERVEFAGRILAFGEISDDQFTGLMTIIRPLHGEADEVVTDLLAALFKRFLDGDQLERAFSIAKVMGTSGVVGKSHGIKCHQELIKKHLATEDVASATSVAGDMYTDRDPELITIIEMCLKSGKDEEALSALRWLYDPKEKNRLAEQMAEQFLKERKLESAADAVLIPSSFHTDPLPDSRKGIAGRVCDALIKAKKWREALSLIREEWSADQEFMARAKQVYEGALTNKRFTHARDALLCFPKKNEILDLFKQLRQVCDEAGEPWIRGWLDDDMEKIRQQQSENKSENKERT